jgi:kynurenine/2-aminoadipate aminotransferase
MKLPNMISLGSGAPNPALFPFDSVSFTANEQQYTLTKDELDLALQYSPTPGLPDLVQNLSELQSREHNMPIDAKKWGVCVTSGSQDALTKAFEMVLNPGQPLLVENPTYSGSLAHLQPYGTELVSLGTDAEGIIPQELQDTLESYDDWLSDKKGQEKPKVLYCIPTGQNPGGSTMSNERKQRIYDICCEHDILIIEDDPYYFLHYGLAPYDVNNTKYDRTHSKSFWELDTEDRVLRFDSMSKVLSSGLRIGWVTGPTEFIRQIELHAQATSLHTSGLSQVLTSKLLTEWGPQGWNDHTDNVAAFYHQKRDVFLAAANTHLSEIATWTVPAAGMFAWIKLNSITDTKELIEQHAVKANVLFVPGQSFDPLDRPSAYVRVSFSLASDADIEEALKRLATLVEVAPK